MVQLGGPMGLSLAPYIFKKPGLHKFIKPWANMFVNVAGYRKVGLRYDDLRQYFLEPVIIQMLNKNQLLRRGKTSKRYIGSI
jgi:hypothetical protein